MKKESFNSGWRFALTGQPKQPIQLPHDAMLVQGRDPESAGGSAHGWFVGGIYEYEKTFAVPAGWQNKHVELQFEGVYRNAKIYLNGAQIGEHIYGYTPFFLNLDANLQYGRDNTILVVADNSQLPNSRWYSGGGIYRPVWLWVGEKNHIDPEGIRITTDSIDPPCITVQTAANGGEAVVEILDNGSVIATAKGSTAKFTLPNAQLWSENNPYLYTCRVTLDSGDTAETAFGIRKVTWDNKGLYINGEQTLLRGGCIHHDNGILGSATWDDAEYRRVEKLKEAGYNAIRSAHNPTSRALLETCDKLGMYVMDEAWDMWFHHKSAHDYASAWSAHHMEDLKAMVRQDYNHPSVILYSIGNEVSEPAKDEGIEAIKEMVAYLHKKDSSRAVTGGFNLMIISSAKSGGGIYDNEKGGFNGIDVSEGRNMDSNMFNMITNILGSGMNNSANSEAADAATAPALDLLDIAGYNYASGRYPLEGKAHPDRLVFGSETFPQDIAKNWAMVKQYPYLIGDFMWTAWDYLGEAGLGAWAYTSDGIGFDKPYPWVLADCGVIDILGNPGAPVALARAAWGLDKEPWLGVQPVNHPETKPAKAAWRGSNAIHSWAWRGCDGNEAVIEVYSSAAAAEVLVNGISIGKQKLELCKASFTTQFVPGTVEAIVYDENDNAIGHSILHSAQGDLHIATDVEKYKELAYVQISLADAGDIVEQNADEELTVSVKNGTLLGFGSANPRTEESYLDGRYKTYYGHALAIVRPDAGCKVKISGTTLEPTEITL